MTGEIEILRSKLAASEGKPGLAGRVAAIKERIARLEGAAGNARFRDIETGQFVTPEYALANPSTTIMEEGD